MGMFIPDSRIYASICDIKSKVEKVSFSMVCCHIEFLETFLATYSRIPNKRTESEENLSG